MDATTPGYWLFETALGTCAIAWRGDTVLATSLPEMRAAALRQRMLRRAPGAVERAPEGAPERAIAEVAAGIAALLDGREATFEGVDLAPDGLGAFDRAVQARVRAIPRGATLTYGEVAAAIAADLAAGGEAADGDASANGAPQAGEAARAVGRALARNPFPIVVPCHRVVAAGGRPGGFSADGGVATKLRILALEGAPAAAQGDLFR